MSTAALVFFFCFTEIRNTVSFSNSQTQWILLWNLKIWIECTLDSHIRMTTMTIKASSNRMTGTITADVFTLKHKSVERYQIIILSNNIWGFLLWWNTHTIFFSHEGWFTMIKWSFFFRMKTQWSISIFTNTHNCYTQL